ncbi:MAG: bifunctional phosphopantothenoylcysteine decarboxylase/phosphopantothenate--cysteine ligase CoaBC [Nitrospirota bacterium]
MSLKNKKVILGVTGSVAAYKSAGLARRLTEAGASVHVIMTDASKNFITPLSLSIASQNKVYSGLFDDPISHITLTADADVMVIAPATANIIGKFANGIADDFLSTCFLSFRGRVVIAPAMNWRMYENPVFKRNLDSLLSYGIMQIGPDKGSLACGEEGAGRMAEVQDIIDAVISSVTEKDLNGRKILVTAGPTREYIDPVRFISNRSSGKMGFAIAKAAIRRGAEVILISGPSDLMPPPKAQFIRAETASGMREAVLRHYMDCDAVIMAAAVADFTPADMSSSKVEKSETMVLNLVKTPDILAEIGALKKRPFLVGFAAETGQDTSRARRKLIEKGADFIVFNNVASELSGFDVDTNEITIIERDKITPVPLMTKDAVADVILGRITELIT